MKRILVTFAGGLLAHGICTALRASKEPLYIIGTDSSKFHVHQAEADEIHLVPRGSEPDYIEILSQVARETKPDLIWPMHDDEVDRVAAVADSLPWRTWLPPMDVVSVCRDKLATNLVLKEAGVPVPETILVNTKDDLEKALDTLGGEIWLRATVGAGGKGAFQTSDLDKAIEWVEQNDGWGTFTAAEVLQGPKDLTQDLIWKNGELIACQYQHRLLKGYKTATDGPPAGRGVQLADAPDEVNVIAEQSVRAVMPEPDGLFRVDMVEGPGGVPHVTEVDCGRFSSGGPVNWYSLGINLAHVALKLAFDEPLDFETPVINPYPKDYLAIGGRNTPQTFMPMRLADEQERSLVTRRAKLAS